MGKAEARVQTAAAIACFVVLVLCGLGLALFAVGVAAGAPHALPSMPALAGLLFLLAAMFVAAGVMLLRRSARSVSNKAAPDAEDKVPKRLYAAAVLALVIVIGAIVFPFLYAPRWPAKGSVQVGAYMYEPTLTSSCAANAHRIFYNRRVVTKVAGNVIVSPRNSSRILYDAACSSNGSESGVFYYAPSLSAPVQANPLSLYEIPRDIDLYWSPNDKFVIVPSYAKPTLLDLETGRRSEYLSDVFAKREKDAASTSASFLAWSPDGKRMAIRVHASYIIGDYRSFTETAELLSVDPETLLSTYVGEMPKGSATEWVAKDGSYELIIVPRPQDGPLK